MSVDNTEEPVVNTGEDTSVVEDTQDTGVDDTDLEDMDVSFDEETDEGSEESEEEDESANESETEEEDDVEDSEDSQESESEEEQADTSDSKQEVSEDEQKRHNAEMAQRRIAEREEQRRQEVARREAEQQYLDKAENTEDLRARESALNNYKTLVSANEAVLEASMYRALADIDLFKTGSPEQQEALLEAAQEFDEIYIERDQYGNALNVKKDLYQHLTKKADSIRKLTSVGARQETKNKAKQKARTDNVPNRKPQEPKKDAMLDGFDEEASRY